MKKRLFTYAHLLSPEAILFSLLILLELTRIIILIAECRLVLHDTLFCFILQYYFLNNVAVAGEVPQWIPYLTHGTTAAFFYGFFGFGGILFNMLLQAGHFLRGMNALPLYYWGMFFDELILLTGVWFLAKRYFSSILTVFFVTVSILGSSLWMTQVFFNFHLYYAIPLALHFFHSFLETGKWRYFFLSLNLFVVQSLSNNAYFIPVISLTIFLYFMFFFAFYRRVVWQQIGRLRFGWPALGCGILTIGSFLSLYALFRIAMDPQVVQYQVHRSLDGSVPLYEFLSYGVRKDFFMWLEPFLGFSVVKDYTLYLGTLTVPLVFLSFISNSKKKLLFLALIIVFLLFGAGSFLAVFFYYVWPLMKFYRHLSFLAPLIRVFFCFLAGFGFEAIFINKTFEQNNGLAKNAVIFTVFALFGIAFYLLAISYHKEISLPLCQLMIHGKTAEPSLWLPKIESRIFHLLRISSARYFLLAIFMGMWHFTSSKRLSRQILGIVLVFHVLDMYGYSFYETRKRTIPVDKEQYKIAMFEENPFVKRRTNKIWSVHPRAKILSSKVTQHSALYWVVNAFLFNDPVRTSLITLYWQRPFDDFLRAYLGKGPESSFGPPVILSGRAIAFPQEHPAARKFSGFQEDKIQFFSNAYFPPERKKVKDIMIDHGYAGDVLFVSKLGGLSPESKKVRKWAQEDSLAENQRISIPYSVQRFDSNHIQIGVNIPQKDGAWLFYSDVWHPQWTATVNNQPTPVYKANLAYKAVPLQPGVNNVHLFFQSKGLSLLYRLFAFNSLFLFIVVLQEMCQIWVRGKE